MTISPRAMQRQNRFPAATGVPGGSVSVNNTVSTTFSGTVSVTFSGALSGAVSIAAASTGGYVPSTSTALSSAAFTITTSPSTLGGYFIGNPNTGSFAYVQLFDAATVTVGTTAPVVVLPIPAGGGANLQPLIAFANSIKAAATTTPTGSASLTSSLVASFWYK